MIQWKRIAGLLLGVVLLLCLAVGHVFAAGEVTVYLDPVNGNDSADGLSEATAVLTVAKAYEKLASATEARIVFLDTLMLSADTSFPKTTVPVTITSKDGTQGIASTNAVRFFGPTTLENMTVTLTKASATASQALYGEGNKFVIGENVTSIGTNDYYFSVSGGSRWSTVNSTDLTVQSGTWRNGYAAAYGYSSSTINANVKGDAKITVTGGTFTGFISPMYQSNTISGNVEISVSNAVISSGIYASPASSGTVAGNVTVTVGPGMVDVSPLYAGSTKSGSVTGSVTIILDGADHEIENLSGKGLAAATGTVGASRLLLKSGTLYTTPKNFSFVDIAIDTGKTLTINGCTLEANTLSSAGTLAFSDLSQLEVGQVVGAVSCTVEGNVLSNHTYLSAPAGSNVTFASETGITEHNGAWQKQDLENFQGLVLTAAEGVTFDLYQNFGNEETAENLVEPYIVMGNSKYYPTITGRYHWAASGAGRYSMRQNVWMSEEEAMTRTEIDVTPSFTANTGWEQTNAVVRLFTEEFLEKVTPSHPDLWPEYKHLLVTPSFTVAKADHQFTTQDEMESFIAGMDDADDDMYVYTLSKTPGGRNVPIVIFTEMDLSGVETVEEAAKLIIADSEQNGKLTVHHQAFMHGDEPAAGETALAMVKYYDEDLGEKLLDKMNIYVIPWLNPDGAYKHLRTELGSCIYLEHVKRRYHIMADVMFQPHVAFDNHEADAQVKWTVHNHADMLISPAFNTESTQAFIDISKVITDQAFVDLKEQGMSYNYYTALINHSDGTSTRSYYARKGVMTFLMESCGAFSGRTAYERRTLAGVISCESLLTSIHDDAENVKSIIVAEQAKIIEEGTTFSAEDLVPLHVTTTEHPEFSYELQSINTATGVGTPTTVIPTIYDKVERSRIAPTAYVIPAGQGWNAEVLELCDRLGLAYTEIPAGSTVLLRQYIGDGKLADLTQEKAVSFAGGAYVICMNQANSRNLAFMMEPDHGDGTGAEVSLVQMGVIPVINEEMPIYRYEHDLNKEGFIDLLDVVAAPQGLEGIAPTEGNNGVISGLDANVLYEYRLEGADTYTEVPAGSTQITGLAEGKYYVRVRVSGSDKLGMDAVVALYSDFVVYLDQANGSDNNDGYSEAAPVATIEKAYSQLSVRIEDAPAGTAGKVVFLSNYEISTKIVTLPKHDFPVVLTSKDGTVGIKRTATAQYNRLAMGGDTTFENITLIVDTPDAYNYLLGNGYKLIIGKNVNTPGPRYYNLAGGQFQSATGSTYLEVRSGTWQNIYYAGYQGNTNGDATFIMTDSTVRNSVMASFNKTVSGNATIYLENTTITSYLYSGSASAGSVAGDVQLTLGKGVTASEIYTGGNNGGVGGTSTIIVDGADLTSCPLFGGSRGTGTVGKSVLVYKSGTLGTYSGFDEFIDQSAVEPEAVRGDLNNDGVVSDADAMYLLRYTLFGDGRYPLNQSGDVDGDGVVSDADAMYLLRFTLFGPSRYPLH